MGTFECVATIFLALLVGATIGFIITGLIHDKYVEKIREKIGMPPKNIKFKEAYNFTSEVLAKKIGAKSKYSLPYMGFVGAFYCDNIGYSCPLGCVGDFQRYLLKCGLNVFLVADRPDGLTEEEKKIANMLNEKYENK